MKTNEEIQALLDVVHREAGLSEDVEFHVRDHYVHRYGPPSPDLAWVMWYVERGDKEYGKGYLCLRKERNIGEAGKAMVEEVVGLLEKLK